MLSVNFSGLNTARLQMSGRNNAAITPLPATTPTLNKDLFFGSKKENEGNLKNGSYVPVPVANVIYLSLQSLSKQNPIALYELAMKARDNNHRLFGNTGEVLKELALLDSDGSIHDLTRDVVLSAIEGEGLDLKLVSPFKPEQKQATPKLDTLEELEDRKAELGAYYEKAQDIAKFIKAKLPSFENWTKEGINPFYDRIPFDGAIGLKMYYGAPSSLLTPLGEMKITGSGCHPNNMDEVMQELTDTLGLVEVLPEVNDTMGCHGPIYAITKDLNGNPLPQLDATNFSQKFMANRSVNLDYNQAQKLLKEVGPQERKRSQ
jgi:hypothetical protein